MESMRIAALGFTLWACGCSDNGTTTPPETSFEHCGDIAEDETWVAGKHTVTCAVKVDKATLTIEAGAHLVFGEGAGILVGCDNTGIGALVTKGTSSAPVTMTSESGIRGKWTYLKFCAGADATKNALAYTEVSNAGAYDNTTARVALHVERTEVLVDNVTIMSTEGRGFTLDDDARFAPMSTKLIVSDSRDEAGLTLPYGAGSIPDGTYTGNGDDRIHVYSGILERSDTWKALGVPWFVSSGVNVRGKGGETAALTIAPGATVQFGAGRMIEIGGASAPAALVAVGTNSAKISFTGEGNPDAGFWEGIVIEGASVDAQTKFDFVDIGYAKDGISFNNANGSVDNASIHDSKNCGIRLLGDSTPTIGAVSYSMNTQDQCL